GTDVAGGDVGRTSSCRPEGVFATRTVTDWPGPNPESAARGRRSRPNVSHSRSPAPWTVPRNSWPARNASVDAAAGGSGSRTEGMPGRPVTLPVLAQVEDQSDLALAHAEFPRYLGDAHP